MTVKGAAALTVEAIATATGAWSADLKVAASAVAATITVTGDGSQPPTVLTGVKLGGRGLLSERSGADPTTVIRCVGNCDSRVARPAAALPGLAMYNDLDIILPNFLRSLPPTPVAAARPFAVGLHEHHAARCLVLIGGDCDCAVTAR